MKDNTNELLTKIMQQRAWYKILGIKKQLAFKYKKLFFSGNLKEIATTQILKGLGYEKEVIWKKKI